MFRINFKTWFKQLVLLCLIALVLPGMALAANQQAKSGDPSAPVYQMLVEENVEFPMRDGIITRGVVFRPDAEGTFPAILCSSPYGTQRFYEIGEYFAQRGYVYVARDARGRFISDGEFDYVELHIVERNDQFDTIDWIVAQPWSDGQVAVEGASYYGQSTMQSAISGHPNLVCAIPMITSENVWREWYYRGGALELVFTSHWTGSTFGPNTAQRILDPTAYEEYMDLNALYNADRETFIGVIPISDFEPAQIGPDYNMFKFWLDHPSMDEYWASISPEAYISSINIPLLHVGGWYDIFSNGTVSTYLSARDHAYTKFARDNQYLMMGPWPHIWLSSNLTLSEQSLEAFGAGLLSLDIFKLRLGFFDYWMKDLLTENFNPEDRVLYYTLGGEGKWNTAQDWPLPNVVETAFYLSDEAKSGSIASLNDGKLVSAPPQNGQSVSYVYDPMEPNITLGGNLLYQFAYGPYGSVQPGPVPQNEVDQRSLTFTSDPLSETLEIGGKVTAILYAASSAVDTDFVVRVSDVFPDGTSINVVDGIQRARYRNSPINPTLITPDEIYQYDIDLWSTSYIFEAGHQIRVTVNSSSFPRWSRNMNVAEQPEKATDWVVANNTIYLDPAHPSHVILPVISK